MNAEDAKLQKFDSKIIIHCPANFDTNAIGGFTQPLRKARMGGGKQPTKNCNSIIYKDIFQIVKISRSAPLQLKTNPETGHPEI